MYTYTYYLSNYINSSYSNIYLIIHPTIIHILIIGGGKVNISDGPLNLSDFAIRIEITGI